MEPTHQATKAKCGSKYLTASLITKTITALLNVCNIPLQTNEVDLIFILQAEKIKLTQYSSAVRSTLARLVQVRDPWVVSHGNGNCNIVPAQVQLLRLQGYHYTIATESSAVIAVPILSIFVHLFVDDTHDGMDNEAVRFLRTTTSSDYVADPFDW